MPYHLLRAVMPIRGLSIGTRRESPRTILRRACFSSSEASQDCQLRPFPSLQRSLGGFHTSAEAKAIVLASESKMLSVAVASGQDYQATLSSFISNTDACCVYCQAVAESNTRADPSETPIMSQLGFLGLKGWRCGQMGWATKARGSR